MTMMTAIMIMLMMMTWDSKLSRLLPAPYFSLFFVTCILLNNKYNLVSLHALRTYGATTQMMKLFGSQ